MTGGGRPGALDRLDAFQQRHRGTALVAATVAEYREDGAGLLANLLAYSAFLAVFPLVLILLTLVEVLLFGHPSVQRSTPPCASSPTSGTSSATTSLASPVATARY
jgi:hypothetical protein